MVALGEAVLRIMPTFPGKLRSSHLAKVLSPLAKAGCGFPAPNVKKIAK
jgi:hypothetical protein